MVGNAIITGPISARNVENLLPWVMTTKDAAPGAEASLQMMRAKIWQVRQRIYAGSAAMSLS